MNIALSCLSSFPEYHTDVLKSVGESFDISYPLEPNQCNVYFSPRSVTPDGVYLIASRGRLLEDDDDYDCDGIRLTKPCGISIDDLEKGCRGCFEIRDSNNQIAVSVAVGMIRK